MFYLMLFRCLDFPLKNVCAFQGLKQVPRNFICHILQIIFRLSNNLAKPTIIEDPILLPFAGVESPQAVQKMLSLAQNSRVKYQAGGVFTTGSSTPAQSPSMPSKGVRMRNSTASTTLQRTPSLSHPRQLPSSELQPVDLNAESSSVTNLYSSMLKNAGTPFCLHACGPVIARLSY